MTRHPRTPPDWPYADGAGVPVDAVQWHYQADKLRATPTIGWSPCAMDDVRLRSYQVVVPVAEAISISGLLDLFVRGPPPPDLADTIAYWHAFESPGAGAQADAVMHLTDGVWMLVYFATSAPDGGIAEQGAYLTCGFDVASRPPIRGHQLGLGICFHAHVGRHLLGIAGQDLVRQRRPMADAWRPWGSQLFDRLQHARSMGQRLEHIFATVRRALQRPRLNDFILAQQMSRRITSAAGNVRMIDLARELGVSTRTMERCAREHLGLSPKRFARVRRQWAVTRAAMADEVVDWSDLALSLGYSDQAHLTRDFTDSHGLSPGRFRQCAGQRGVIFGSYAFMPGDLAVPG